LPKRDWNQKISLPDTIPLVVELQGPEVVSFFEHRENTMPPRGKKRLRSKCEIARLAKQIKEKRIYIRRKRWEDHGEVMKTLIDGMKNKNGKSRSSEENKLLIYTIQAVLNRRIDALKDKSICPTEVSWRNIEEEVPRDSHVRCEHITDLRK
jgi:hypothetical protein